MIYEDLKGKKVLVTGSSSGIGAATAVMFSQQGSFVGVHYFRTKEGGEKTLKKVSVRIEIKNLILFFIPFSPFPLQICPFPYGTIQT